MKLGPFLLAEPWWLVLAAVFVAIHWQWPVLGLFRPLRLFLWLLLVLLLSAPSWESRSGDLDLWVLVDRSASIEPQVEAQHQEWYRLLEASRPAEDRLRWLDFANAPIEQRPEHGFLYSDDRRSTQLGQAVEAALASRDPQRSARLLVFTDGQFTDDLTNAEAALRQAQISMDLRLLSSARLADWRIDDFRIPTQVRPGEPFLLEVHVRATSDGPVDFILRRQGQAVGRASINIEGGRGVARLVQRAVLEGAELYQVELMPEGDAIPANNIAEAWVESVGEKRVVLITAYPDDPIGMLLNRNNIRVEVISQASQVHLGKLSGASAVILHNVHASHLPESFLSGLDFFVREQGGGLLMVGGKHSFGSGGYFQSSLDELLPVSMELRQEHRKLMMALAVVLDRSGSMSMMVAGGRSKMELANEGTARTVELLGDQDWMAVHAVDTEAHEIVPMVKVGPQREEIMDRSRRIQSMGGGIYVYTGLKQAWETLQEAPVGQRHIILFSDASDSEEPGQYQQLIAEMRREQATISVIALGRESDPDAGFLKDIAERGEGRIFFSDNASTLPTLFAQETVAVSRSTFVEEAAGVLSLPGWLEMSTQPLEWLSRVDGYNLCYIREGASLAALSQDEFSAPLTAFWQRGLGRVAAITFPIGGEFSESSRAWPELQSFLMTINRWLEGESGLQQLMGRARDINGILEIEAWHGPEASLDAQPSLVLHATNQNDGSSRQVQLEWQRTEVGRLSARLPLERREIIRGVIHSSEGSISFGPFTAGKDQEWSDDRNKTLQLRQLMRSSGGSELTQLGDAWSMSRSPQHEDLRPLLLIVFLVGMLVEAWHTRWSFARVVYPKKISKLTEAKKAKVPIRPQPSVTAQTQPTISGAKVADSAESPEVSRRGRFSRAKRGY